jgi:hypothetical protein
MADKDLVDRPDEWERLLREELALEPSPAFAARVRQRVAGTPAFRTFTSNFNLLLKGGQSAQHTGRDVADRRDADGDQIAESCQLPASSASSKC